MSFHRTRILAEEQVAALYEALTKLSNEVMGSLPPLEPLARREMGNSNYNILIQRAEEARAVLKRIAAERAAQSASHKPDMGAEK